VIPTEAVGMTLCFEGEELRLSLCNDYLQKSHTLSPTHCIEEGEGEIRVSVRHVRQGPQGASG
jgi:hypothetical protein